MALEADDDRKRPDPRRAGAGAGVRARPVRDIRHPVHDERGLSLLRSGAIGGGAHAGPDGGADGSERIDVAGAAGVADRGPDRRRRVGAACRRELLFPLRQLQFLLFGGAGDDADHRPAGAAH